jgi:RNA polymerase sigma-70 factor (ECF subfamily)
MVIGGWGARLGAAVPVQRRAPRLGCAAHERGSLTADPTWGLVVEWNVGVAGERGELEDLFRVEYARLVRTVSVVLNDRDGAADVVQDAFVQARRHWSRVSAYDSPTLWLRRVAINRALSERRGRRRRDAALHRLAAPGSAADQEPSFDFDAALYRLPRGQRAVIALFYVADMPIAEIAQVLDVAEGTVKSQLHDARRALAPQLEVDDGHR